MCRKVVASDALDDVNMQVGDTVTFQLLRRSRTSIIPLVIGDGGDAEAGDVSGSPGTQPQHSAFARRTADEGLIQTAAMDAKGPAPSKGARPASAWAAKPSASPANGPHAEADIADAEPAGCNRFAKFTAAQDVAPLWQRAARELAQYAAQVNKQAPAIWR